MEFENVIRGRRSIRAYTSQPVPEDLVREILDEARWAPSSRNTQAWNVWVVTGRRARALQGGVQGRARPRRGGRARSGRHGHGRLAAGVLGCARWSS